MSAVRPFSKHGFLISSQTLNLDTSELLLAENTNDSNLFDASLDLDLDLDDLEDDLGEEVTFTCAFGLPEVNMTAEETVKVRVKAQPEVEEEEEVTKTVGTRSQSK